MTQNDKILALAVLFPATVGISDTAKVDAAVGLLKGKSLGFSGKDIGDLGKMVAEKQVDDKLRERVDAFRKDPDAFIAAMADPYLKGKLGEIKPAPKSTALPPPPPKETEEQKKAREAKEAEAAKKAEEERKAAEAEAARKAKEAEDKKKREEAGTEEAPTNPGNRAPGHKPHPAPDSIRAAARANGAAAVQALLNPPAASTAAPAASGATAPPAAPATPPTATVGDNAKRWKIGAAIGAVLAIGLIVIMGGLIAWLVVRTPEATVVKEVKAEEPKKEESPLLDDRKATLLAIEGVDGICAACDDKAEEGKTELPAATCDEVAEYCAQCEKHGILDRTCDRSIRRALKGQ